MVDAFAILRENPWIGDVSAREVARRLQCTRRLASRLTGIVEGQRSRERQQISDSEKDGERVLEAQGRRIKTLADLLKAAQVDLAEWQVRDFKANAWEQHSAASGLVTLHQVKAQLERRAVPIRAAHAPAVRAEVAPPRAGRPGEMVLVIPDTQHGCRWLDPRMRRMVTTHDQRAIEVALAMAADLQPDRIVFLGDDLDGAELSKYRKDWSVRQTLQPTIDMLGYNLARFRSACPGALIHMLMGNHDQRLADYTADHAPALDGLRPAGETAPAFSLPRLLHLDALGIDYRGPYGEEDLWLGTADPLVCRHAGKLRADGASSAMATLRAATTHVLVGHEHRRWTATRTIWEQGRPREITVASPGALVRRGGIVPGVSSREDWQQGLAVAWLDDGPTSVELVAILDGRARYGGRVYDGPDGLDELAAATGWGQMVA